MELIVKITCVRPRSSRRARGMAPGGINGAPHSQSLSFLICEEGLISIYHIGVLRELHTEIPPAKGLCGGCVCVCSVAHSCPILCDPLGL